MTTRKIALLVNGRRQAVTDDPETPLLWILRDRLGLTATKYGCGAGLCGACTVLLAGVPARSCQIPLGTASGKPITTLEGMKSARFKRLQETWVAESVPQCGYCQAGMLMSAGALLEGNPRPSEAQVRESVTNLCRCGTYPRVIAAIRKAGEGA